MKKRQRAQVVSRKTKAKKKGWLAKYRIHILSLLGLFALFFGVLSYYQQGTSVLGLAVDRTDGGGSSGPSRSVSISCKKVKSYCDKYGGHTSYSQCARTVSVKSSNPSKISTTISSIRDYTVSTNIKGCKSTYELKLPPTPTPGITLTLVSEDNRCEYNNDLYTDIYWQTSYNSSGDKFSCQNCYFQSGEEKMGNDVWSTQLDQVKAASSVLKTLDSSTIQSSHVYQNFLNYINTLSQQNHSIEDFIQKKYLIPGGTPTVMRKNTYAAYGFLYKNIFDDISGSTSNTTLRDIFVSNLPPLPPYFPKNDDIPYIIPKASDFQGVRSHKIYIVDTTKHVVSNGVDMKSFSCTK